jgi:2-polyprenyl-3-methyl-5-hydroxy-6-metoxy-1,4-benzoquinol methylase
MSQVIRHERALYEHIWSSVAAYADHSPGERYVPLFLDMSRTTMRGSLLDAGCGSGKGALALEAAGFTVSCCDYTDAGLIHAARHLPFTPVCLWHDLKRVVGFRDWVYCCDVLEHVPPPFTMLVISRLLEVARRGVFLSISTQPDQFGAWVGESLHKTVRSFVEWRDDLAAIGTVVEARDLLNAGIYLVTRC